MQTQIKSSRIHALNHHTDCEGKHLPPSTALFVFGSVFLINLFMYLFIYLFILFIFGCVGSLLLRAGFSLVAASGGYSSLRCAGFSLQWLLLFQSTGSRHVGFSSCVTRAR